MVGEYLSPIAPGELMGIYFQPDISRFFRLFQGRVDFLIDLAVDNFVEPKFSVRMLWVLRRESLLSLPLP